MKKVLITLALLLPMVVSADPVEIDGIYYNLIPKGKIAEVTSNPNKYTGIIEIPTSITYEDVDYDITSISSSAFSNCSNLTSVTIGNSVTNIGNYAFRDCSRLSSVDIGNSVTNIGDYAFSGCSNLINLPLPNSLTSIGSYAFQYCSGLTSVTIGNSLNRIGESAFYNCTGLTSVTISDIAKWCEIIFEDQSSNPLNRAHQLYIDGEEIKDLIVPNSVTCIRDYAFWYCSGLKSVTIPNSVTSIGYGAFYRCTGLTSVTIHSSVNKIGERAFYDCSSLTSIFLPNSLTNIGERAFFRCTGLTNISLPNSVTNIDNSAFSGCSGLTSLIIPNSVERIGSSAFINCSSLTSVTIGNSVAYIDEKAFSNCPEITDLFCDAMNVPFTASNCFEGSYIEYATLHVPTASLESYRTTAPWSSIQTIVASDAIVEMDGVYYRLLLQTGKAEVTNNPNKYTGVVDIKAVVSYEGVDYEVTSIAENAFEGCISPTSVIIPNSIVEINDFAFAGCSGLTSVTIPNSVTSIGVDAFCQCSSLTNVTIPNSVTSIGESAFYSCSGLTSVIIPNSVTSIGSSAFFGCSGLTSVTIPNSVTIIGESAFSDCFSLTSVTIPNSVTRIESGTFYTCSCLKSVTIPNSVMRIGDVAFSGCGLVSVTIPSSVTSIESGTFSYCSKLRDVYCYAVNAPTTNTDAFLNSSISSATLHVPAESMSSYKAKAPWSDFGNFVALDGEIPPVPEKCATPTIAFANGKLTFECETEGAEFVYNVSLTGGQSNSGNEVHLPSLPPTYTVTVYAKKEGYENSDVATYVVTYQTKAGDANGDGEITIADAVKIVDVILGDGDSSNARMKQNK